MALRLKTLGLYRQLLRNSKNLPISLEVKRKMIYNVHEIFRIRMRAPPTKVPEYHKNAEFALEIMNKMNLVPEKVFVFFIFIILFMFVFMFVHSCLFLFSIGLNCLKKED